MAPHRRSGSHLRDGACAQTPVAKAPIKTLPVAPANDLGWQAMLDTPAALRTLYVSPTGDDANDGMSAEHPFKSPQKAVDISRPGDHILFAGGDYVISSGDALMRIERSGAPGQPIVYAPMPGAQVNFINRGAWNVIRVMGARHLEFRGFHFDGDNASLSLAEARKQSGNLNSPNTSRNALAVSNNRETKVPSAYVVIRDCVISDFSGGGTGADHSDYILIENNVVARCGWYSPFGHSGISIYQPTDVDNSTGYKIIIRNNVCYGNYNNIPFFYSDIDLSKRFVTDGNGIILDDYLNSQAWGGGTKPYGGRTLVANNVTFRNGGSGIHTFLASRVDIVYNLAFENSRHPDIAGGEIYSNKSSDIKVLDNILVASDGKPVNTDHNNGDGVVYDHNLYATTSGVAPVYGRALAHNIIGTAGVELGRWDTGSRQIVIAPNDALKNAGAPFPGVKTDFFGKARDPQICFGWAVRCGPIKHEKPSENSRADERALAESGRHIRPARRTRLR